MNDKLEHNLEQNYHFSRALQFLTQEIREAEKIISPQEGQESDQLTIQGDNQWDIKNYSVKSQQLRVEKNTGVNPVANEIKSVKFQVLDDGSTVKITLEAVDENTKLISTVVTLRS